MIATGIALVLSNWFVLLFAISIVTTVVKVRRARFARRPVNVAYVLWGELLFYNVGLDFFLTGILHGYFQPFTAGTIGWTPSPFEYELAWMELPLAVVAMLSLWRGYEFRLATTLIYVTFALAAAAQHIQEIVCCGNYAPSNAGPILWFADIFVPILVLVAAVLSRGESDR